MRANLTRLFSVLLIAVAGHALGAPNKGPVATITSPAGGSQYTAPATVSLTATASDPDGTVVRVDYFRGGTTLIGSSTTPPYAVTWSNVAAGTYSLTAKATDNLGKTGVASTAVSITVAAVTTTITSPAANAELPTGSVFVTGTYSGVAATTSVIVTAGGGHSSLATLSGNTFSASVPISAGPNLIEVQIARADGTGDFASRQVTGTVAPVVAFTAPASCGPFNGPLTLTISADAATEQGLMSGVEFFDGSTSLGTVNSPPYTITRSLSVGTHLIRARATNSFGLFTDTPVLTVVVQSSNTPPTVTLVDPPDGATYTAPASITFTATASDSDGIKRVEFLANGIVRGSIGSPPYQFTWNNVAAGSYDLQARAVDMLDAESTSAPAHRVTVNAAPPNQPPTVSIISPENNAAIDMGTDVLVVAQAADSDGTVGQVLFYADTTLIGGSSGPNAQVTWFNVAPGTYRLKAIAFDNDGASTTSAEITVRVGVHTDPGESIVYLHNDFAGNPIAGTDVTGAVLWKENYRPFGGRLVNSAAAQGNRQWFGGKAADTETGLSYFGARYYDPILGRFMARDPKRFDGQDLHTFNSYAYANNNPYANVDPDGRVTHVLGRAVFQVSFSAATRLGAKEVGERLGYALWILLNSDTESGKGKEEKQPAPSEGEKGKKCNNPDGCNGKQDHRDKTGELSDRARGEAGEGEQVLENKKIRGHDSNRKPDVQIVDKEGRTRKIYEAERHPDSARNRAREAEYDRLGIPHETHGLGN